ncbi:transcriptional regulator [Rhodococcus ruber Chol-4]|uniref:HTH-type transcriptional repressor NsrR n=2 Tax=Rhodococcus ruber TaxID=1830 RepID=A0A098BR53_9NOCA|nr:MULTISPECIES: Rrf2 family transcriptional regulator [Rhodococcus]RIK05893.1 MAG: Rrf2 family transcriptional regulator [Acidobacteriota bacterium]ATQ31106.1 Rrf2 family transcriptional regulator [Rhodococcus ruber]AUM16264.1 Rrf2 family transcriptional regulator [Rhodococcus ruber]AWG98048.1 Rrf2 family transcriptional regulator [Rhodococcus ruber]AXY50896.1 transcriptional regulator [Rhodococcus ruber]
MQLTQFTDLGLRVVMYLAAAAPDSSPSTRSVAEQLELSYAHTTKVVARLSELGVVTTRRGRGGGLAITELGRSATVGWLARQLEGDNEVVACEGDKPCPLRAGCSLRGALRRAQEAFYTALDAVTVADLARPPTRTVLLELTRPAV